MGFRKVDQRIWNDENFIGLSHLAQRLFIYLFTNPHGNLIGLYVLKTGYITDDLRISDVEFSKLFREVIEKNMAMYDYENKVILVKNFLKYNPVTNTNHLKCAKDIIAGLPSTRLIREFALNLSKFSEFKGLNKMLLKALVKDFDIIEIEIETETEREINKKKHSFENSPYYDYEKFSIALKDWGPKKIRHYYDSARGGSAAKGYMYLNWILAVRNWDRMHPFMEKGGRVDY